MERVHELQNEFEEAMPQAIHEDRISSRSLYTIVIYLTGRRDESDAAPPFSGEETNLLENSSNEKLLYTDDEGNFQDDQKRIFASVIPERGAALVFYQKGLLHEGADLGLADLPSAQPYLNKKIILRSDVFFQRRDSAESGNLGSDREDQNCTIGEADRA